MFLKKGVPSPCASSGISDVASITSWATRQHPPPSSGFISRSPSIRHRAYSTLRRDRGDDDQTGLLRNWPKTLKPTPYEIFDQKAGSPYDKARFYQLVKLYHPDRYRHGAHHGLSHATKLERYRLVIAANDILCNPEKRQAYDSFGAGWDRDLPAMRAKDKSWRKHPDTAAYNATWEDWEQWYQRRNGEKQEPVFMSNGGFAVLVVAFVAAGIVAQAARAGNRSMSLIEMREQRHRKISKELHDAEAERGALSREGRVQNFLRQREGWGYGEYPAAGHLPTDAGRK